MSWTWKAEDGEIELVVERDAVHVVLYVGIRQTQPYRVLLQPEEAEILADVLRATVGRMRLNREACEP